MILTPFKFTQNENGGLNFDNFFSSFTNKKANAKNELMSSLNEDKSALEGFFKEFDGNNFESAMSSHLGKASDSAREFAQKVVTANSQVALSEQETSAKIKEYSAQQSVSIENKVSKISSIGSKLKGFGANLLTGLASGAAWAAVGLAIEGVAKGIDYLANKDKKAAEDAQKLTDSYKKQEDTFRNNTSTLKGMQSEFNQDDNLYLL